jgi:hypothetical protein
LDLANVAIGSNTRLVIGMDSDLHRYLTSFRVK